MDDIKFEDLGLSPEVMEAVKKAGYETPSPIQARAIPPMLRGENLLGTAQTGTGKTAASTPFPFTAGRTSAFSSARSSARRRSSSRPRDVSSTTSTAAP